jgi:membrane protease YdiL (CAAX protease family)
MNTTEKQIKNNDVLNSCFYNELIKYDPSKPMADLTTQIVTALAIIILNSIILQIVIKNYPETNVKTINQNINSVLDKEKQMEFKNYHKKLISPNILALSEVVNASLYAPIIEEVFFRIILLKLVLIRYFKLNVHIAILLHATIFGAFHMTNVITSDQEFNKTVVQSVSAGLSGVVYGYAYIHTNSIFTPLLAHFINNIMSTTYDYIEYSKYYNQIVNKKH